VVFGVLAFARWCDARYLSSRYDYVIIAQAHFFGREPNSGRFFWYTLARKFIDGLLLYCCIDIYHGCFSFCAGHATPEEGRLDRTIMRWTTPSIRKEIVIATGALPSTIVTRGGTRGCIPLAARRTARPRGKWLATPPVSQFGRHRVQKRWNKRIDLERCIVSNRGRPWSSLAAPDGHWNFGAGRVE
jgi:hypothetical protein